MRGVAAAILGFLAALLLKAGDRLERSGAPLIQLRARERFRAAVLDLRRANQARTEDDIARDVEAAIQEVREATRTASGR